MDAADVAQIASAVFTALAALAALLTVRQARHETRISHDALEAETQPLITDVPRGIFIDEVDWHEVDGTMTRKRRDRSELDVGVYGGSEPEPEPVSVVSVPVRNVGNGPARITDVTFETATGTKAPGSIDNPVLPPGEMTRASIAAGPSDPDVGVAEALAMEYQDFALVVAYGDASGHPREVVRLQVTNGQHPRITTRSWARDSTALEPWLAGPPQTRDDGDRANGD